MSGSQQLGLHLRVVARDGIDGAFQRFHRANPQVYEALRNLAFKAVNAGKQRLGIGMLWEVMRWELWLGTADASFKLNNNYRSRYARLLMEQEPRLRGVFETRELRSD